MNKISNKFDRRKIQITSVKDPSETTGMTNITLRDVVEHLKDKDLSVFGLKTAKINGHSVFGLTKCPQCCIIRITEPTTPLNNADQGGTFYLWR